MKNALIILALALLAFACGEPVQPEPVETPGPALVSISPPDGTGGIEGSSLSVVFTFDQNILCTSASLAGVSVDGGAFIEKASPAGAALTVVVSGLARGRQYTVTLPAGTARGFKPDQKASAAVTYRFSTKEPDPAPDPGSWESAASAVKNMGAGWNLGNTLDTNSGDVTNMWFEAYSDRTPTAYETGWGQPVTTRALIHMFKEAGFNAIRVPVTWYPHMGTLEVNGGRWNMDKWLESTDYRVDPAWMARVREVVGYVLDEGMYCILNVHHDTGDHGEKKNGTAWLVADRYDAVKDRFVAAFLFSPLRGEDVRQKVQSLDVAHFKSDVLLRPHLHVSVHIDAAERLAVRHERRRKLSVFMIAQSVAAGRLKVYERVALGLCQLNESVEYPRHLLAAPRGLYVYQAAAVLKALEVIVKREISAVNVRRNVVNTVAEIERAVRYRRLQFVKRCVFSVVISVIHIISPHLFPLLSRSSFLTCQSFSDRST